MTLSSNKRPSLEALVELFSYQNPKQYSRFRSSWSKPEGILDIYPNIGNWEEDTFLRLRTAYSLMDAYHLKEALIRSSIHKSRRSQILKNTLDHPLLTNVVSKSEYFCRNNFSARSLNYALSIYKIRILKDTLGFLRVLTWLDRELERITPFEDHYRALLLAMQCEIYVHIYHMQNDKNLSILSPSLLGDVEDHLYNNLDFLREFVALEIGSLTSREGNDTLFNAAYLVSRVITFIEDISILNRKSHKIFGYRSPEHKYQTLLPNSDQKNNTDSISSITVNDTDTEVLEKAALSGPDTRNYLMNTPIHSTAIF